MHINTLLILTHIHTHTQLLVKKNLLSTCFACLPFSIPLPSFPPSNPAITHLTLTFYLPVCGNVTCVMLQYSSPSVQPLVMVTFLLQKNWAPLLIASCNGHLQVVKSLIEAGSNVNQANKVSTQCQWITFTPTS